MISKYGTVIVTEDKVTITGFTFEEVNFKEAEEEAIAWAFIKLGRIIDNEETTDRCTLATP